ncbi:MAG TPA: MlaD family protein [Candidatus Baltobacteraceae bacterium]|jgi:ABC-type transporter Mla subunit MlaD
MTKQAQVGLFAALAMLLLFGLFYVITDYGTRHSGYRLGVHFDSAAGLQSGSLVYFSGVTVGSVDGIVLLPDNTVDVTLAIGQDVDIPRNSKFLIQAPLTGSPNLLIVPPKPGAPAPTPSPWERQVLPIADQPRGTNSATIADLLDQGQGEVKRLDRLMADLETREPKLLDTLQHTLESANSLTNTANATVAQLATQAQLASQNVVSLTDSLNRTVNGNTPRVNSILAQLDQMSVSLNKSTKSLEDIATNKDVKDSLVATTKNIADTTQTISDLTKDLRTITGNPQTQSQLRDTISNVDAAAQRTTSLLGTLGGTSNVYGVDAGATPAPVPLPGASPYPVVTLPPGNYPIGSPAPRTGGADQAKRAQLKAKLGGIVKNLVSIQLRISELSSQRFCCNAPLLSSDRGPMTDINAIFLPVGGTSVMIGGNDFGGPHTTANLAILQSMGRGARIGGGLLYSRLGLIGQYRTKTLGFEGRFYDPRHPTLDLYGDLPIAPGFRLFFGQRDVTHIERRSVYGLQLNF